MKTYRIECFDLSGMRWYVVGTNLSRSVAHGYVLDRKAKGLSARYRVIREDDVEQERAA